jgi:pyridoxal phosphate enzyme (YggS family)
MTIASNVAGIRERIAAAAQRAGRNADDIVLMGVSKTFPGEAVREAYAAGIRVFGENRVQEFAEKFAGIGQLPNAEWRLIGHLQSNKAGKAAALFGAVDSVDSLQLAERLNTAAAALSKKLRVLIEINIGGEEAKAGLHPCSRELEEVLLAAPRLDRLEFQGLMTIPPFCENSEDARPDFRKLRVVRDGIAARQLSGVGMAALSMGMSHDFEIAVEEGSTFVRVGTAIFGTRS